MPEPGSPVAADPSTLDFRRIRYERDLTTSVATVTIDRPDVLNALDLPTLKELSHAFEQASWDESVAVVVVTGAGDRAFCTGADLDEQSLMGATSGQYWRWMGAFIEMHDRLRHIGKPTIARINGICVGGGNAGAGIALVADALEAERGGIGRGRRAGLRHRPRRAR